MYPDAAKQKCRNHKIINVLDKLPKRQHEQAKLMLRGIPYIGSRAELERLRSCFAAGVVNAPTTGPLRVWSVTGVEW